MRDQIIILRGGAQLCVCVFWEQKNMSSNVNKSAYGVRGRGAFCGAWHSHM